MMITWTDILWLAGAIVTITAAGKAILLCIEKVLEPDKKQNARIDEIEAMVREDREAIRSIEGTTSITLRALLALLAHGIDGNDVEAMKQAKEELTGYLINRR